MRTDQLYCEVDVQNMNGNNLLAAQITHALT